MKAIDLKSIRVVYPSPKAGQRVALNDFTLQVDNEMVALLGPNGAGKSTLLNVISQSIIPGSGQVLAPSSRNELSVVFQTPALDELLTVSENLMVAGSLHNLPRDVTIERKIDLCDRLGLSDRLHDQVRHLSGGLARRADLARALVPHPSVLLLDEPTTGLDIDARRIFWDTLDQTRRQLKMTVVMATHITQEAEHADRVILIREGKKIKDDSPALLKASLGERIMRVRLPNDEQTSKVSSWLTHHHVEHVIADQLIIGHHVDPALAASCPVASAAITITPPDLGDVYTYFAQSPVSPLETGELS